MVQSGIEPPTSCGGGSEFYIDPRGRYRMECCRHILCTKCNSMGGIIRCRHRCRHYCVSLLTQSFIDHKSIKVCRHQFLFLIKRPESRPDSKAVMVCPGLLIVLYQSSKIDKELETRTVSASLWRARNCKFQLRHNAADTCAAGVRPPHTSLK
jgi:hypothetical protein